MRKIFTRIIGILGSCVLMLSMIPLTTLAADLPTPAHTKYVTSKGDGTYTLTLDVTGKEESETVTQPADILLIVDTSGSMKQSISGRWSGSRISKVQALIKHLAGVVLPEKTQNQMAVVQFSGNNQWGESAYDDSSEVLDWTTSSQAVTNAASLLGANGGTNWEAGFLEGSKKLSSLDSDRNSKKYVVFLSDGNPTFYYDEDGKTKGNGSSYSNTGYNQAVEAANKIQGATLYSVSIGGSVSTMESFAGAISGTYYDGSTSEALDEAFAAIESQITKNFKGIKISDTLSEYAEMVDSSDLKFSAKDADGNPVDVPQDAVAAYDEASKTITWTFPSEYVLQANVTYSISFDIKATKKAQQEYVSEGNQYPHTGDVGTGDTSAGEKGFFCNSEAKLDYVNVNGSTNTPSSADYAKPVIQVIAPVMELPKAGGPGTWWIFIIGFGMIGFAGTLLIIQKKRHEKGNRGGLYD